MPPESLVVPVPVMVNDPGPELFKTIPALLPLALIDLKVTLLVLSIEVVMLSAGPEPVSVIVLFAPVMLTFPPPLALKSAALEDPVMLTPPLKTTLCPVLFRVTLDADQLFPVTVSWPEKVVVPAVPPLI